MRKFLFLILLVGSYSFGQVNTYSVGDVVDNFTITDTKGEQHTLYDITASGKYVFLDFFFTRCPPCQATQKYFNQLHDKYGCNEGEIYTLSISYDPYDTDAIIDAFEATYGGNFHHSPAAGPQGGGAQVTNNFGINAYPTYCIIGPDNKLVVGDIWPISGVHTYEAAFPSGFAPEPVECTEMSTLELTDIDVVLYPTVSSGQLTVRMKDAGQSNISVFNMNGQQLYSQNHSGNTIELNLDLKPGVYIMKIKTDNKKEATIERFIIK